MALAVALAGNLLAQSAVTVAQDTPFLKEPGGVRLGTLLAGAPVVTGRSAGGRGGTPGFTEVVMAGWIFTASTRADQREGFDLSVASPEGANIRAAPDGKVIGRAVPGTLFKRVAVRRGWTQVRRSGWIVTRESTPSPPRLPPAAASRTGSPDSLRGSPDRRATLRAGVRIALAPDGRSLATVDTPVEVVLGESKGEWLEVRLRGWVRRSEADSAVAPRPPITAGMIRDNPERYVGQTVDWRVQFLAIQEADELRPEMPLGHPYLLARGPLPESGFVYVLISKEEAARLQGTNPLEELALTVTIRAARTKYLATPVVELVRRNP